MKTFRRKEVEKITGIPARRIQFYTDSGLVTMDNLNPKRGNERLYLKSNLLELLVIKEIARHGIELSKLQDVLYIPCSCYDHGFTVVGNVGKKLDKAMKEIHLIDIGEKLNNGTYRTAFVNRSVRSYISVCGSGNDALVLAGKTLNMIEIDMGETASIFIINVSKLAEQLIDL